MSAESWILPFANGGIEQGSVLERPTGTIGELEFAVQTGLSAVTSYVFGVTSAEESRRRRVAERFARFARNIRGVAEVWLDSTLPELEVSIVLRAFDFDRELELRGLFIEAVSEELDLSVGELSVYGEDEEIPASVRRGERLA